MTIAGDVREMRKLLITDYNDIAGDVREMRKLLITVITMPQNKR